MKTLSKDTIYPTGCTVIYEIPKESDMEVKELVDFIETFADRDEEIGCRVVLYGDGSGHFARGKWATIRWDRLFRFGTKDLQEQMLAYATTEKLKKPPDYKSLFSVVHGCLVANFSGIMITEENALPLSIAKWEVICEELEGGELVEEHGRRTCACCKLYDGVTGCPDCPIGDKCLDSPYVDYIGARTLYDAMKAAHDEVEFLKSLMEK